jgi:Icc protein
MTRIHWRKRPSRLTGATLALGVLLLLGAGRQHMARASGSSIVAQQSPATDGPIPVNPNANVGATTTIQNPGVVSWVHIGDLHITTADQQNYQDFQTIIQNTNQYLLNGINFAVLPGDNANDGTAAEYQLIKQATDQLQAPLYDVPGDHDLKSGSLALYEQYLEPVPYQSFTADRYHFVFIDALDASPSGGFGIGADQMAWLTNDLDTAAQQGLQSVLFMHPYPSQLGSSAQAVQDLISKDNVLMVDTGHTHYNDVANDGHTIYAATRSTGQDTEGPVGFSITNLDNGVVSWKFKPLGSWPFVMITSPADKQLITDPSQSNQVVQGTVDLRAKIWDDKGVASATYQIDGGAPQPLTQIGTTQMWSAPWDSTQVSDGDHQITVNVQGAGGNTTEDTITAVVSQSGSYQPPQRSPGAVNNSIGAYAEKGLLGNHTPGAGGPPPGGPGGGPGGPKGPATVVSVDGNVLTLKYGDGTTAQVQVDSSTQITKEVAGALSDLQPGETVDVMPPPAAAAPASATSTGAASTASTSSAQTATQIRIHAAGGP